MQLLEQGTRCGTDLLICSCLLVVGKQLLHVLYATHFLMDLLEHRSALLESVEHVLLHQRELDVARQLFELRQLRIRLR
jgi:hypothetical protein